MSPEAQFVDFARRIHLSAQDLDFIMGLLQQARGLGSVAGAEAEREACVKIADQESSHYYDGTSSGWVASKDIATAIRARGE